MKFKIQFISTNYFVIFFLFFSCKNSIKSDNDFKTPTNDSAIQVNQIVLYSKEQLQINEASEPIYLTLPESDSLKIQITANYLFDMKISSNVTKKELISLKQIKKVIKSYIIPNTDIYKVEISSINGNYVDIKLIRIVNTDETKNFHYQVSTKTIESETQMPNSVLSEKYKFESIFSQPRKITINSSGKKDFTGYGENKVYVPIELPKGTKEWIYRLQISYREKSSQSSLHNDMNTTWNKVNKTLAIASSLSSPFRGILVNRVSNITNTAYKSLIVGQFIDLGTLLYDELNKVPKEEAYINYYVIKGEQNAKKFTEGKTFDYKLASSQKNIQSTEELEKKIIDGQIFIGFENTNMREQVYIQLEVIAIIKYPVYVRTEMKILKTEISNNTTHNIFEYSEKKKLLIEKRKIIKCEKLKEQLEIENNKMIEIEKYKLLRTRDEKQRQIEKQKYIIFSIEKKLLRCY